MTKHSLLYAATALVLTSGVTSAQNQRSQNKTEAPTALQSTTPDKPPIATVPKVATDVAAVPRRPQTSAGWIGGLYDDLSRIIIAGTSEVRPVTCRHGFELGQLGGLRLAPLVVILDWGILIAAAHSQL